MTEATAGGIVATLAVCGGIVAAAAVTLWWTRRAPSPPTERQRWRAVLRSRLGRR